MVYSVDGSSTNTIPSNLMPLTKALTIQSVALASVNTQIASGFSGVDLFTLGPSTPPFTFSIGNKSFNGPIITFMPLGEVTTNNTPADTNGFDSSLGVELRPTRGTQVLTNNVTELLIDGSVGIPTIIRP
jgi:hypothetical protein